MKKVCVPKIVLFCGDQVLVVRILQLCISITYHQGRYIRSIATNGAEVSLMLARCARFQLSPVDRISALLTVSSSWCPGRVQSRSDHVLSARLALCRGTLPVGIRDPGLTLSAFRQQLKTFLFDI